jgi:hypothetical protein
LAYVHREEICPPEGWHVPLEDSVLTEWYIDFVVLFRFLLTVIYVFAECYLTEGCNCYEKQEIV